MARTTGGSLAAPLLTILGLLLGAPALAQDSACFRPPDPSAELLPIFESLIPFQLELFPNPASVYQFTPLKTDEGLTVRGPFAGAAAPEGSGRWWTIVEEAPDCAAGEVAVRPRRYPDIATRGSVEQGFARFEDGAGYYCISQDDFRRLKRTSLAARPRLESGYLNDAYTSLPLSAKSVVVNPWREDDIRGQNREHNIQLRPFTGTHPACTDGGCVVAQFTGPFYGGCSCSPQSYTLLLDREGRAVEFLASTLKYGVEESWLKTVQLQGSDELTGPKKERLLGMLNDPARLREAYGYTWMHLAKRSKARELAGTPFASGAATAAVLLHVPQIRERLLGPKADADPAWLKAIPTQARTEGEIPGIGNWPILPDNYLPRENGLTDAEAQK